MLSLSEYLKLNRVNNVISYQVAGRFWEFYPKSKAIFYDVSAKSKTFKVFAFISIPITRKPKGGYPAVLIMHGGNGMAYAEIAKLWADKGYVAIAPDFNAKCGEDLGNRCIDNLDGGPCGYGFSAVGEDHPWVHFSVLSAMSAIDVLCSMPEVNKNKICTCGLSWGGYLNLALLSQDKRIRTASIIYSSAYTLNSSLGKATLEQMSTQEYENYKKNIEPTALLKDITCPVLFTAGTQDHAFKMENRRRTAEKISGQAYFALRKEYFHGNFYGFFQPESARFFDYILSNRNVPQPKTIKLKNGKIKVKGYFKDSEIRLLFTKDDVQKTEIQIWKTIVVKNNDSITLSPEIKAFFVTEKQKGCQWSSNMFLNH